MSFPPSAACKFLDLHPVNLRNLHLHLTKNPFASRPPHLCGVTYTNSILKHGIEHNRFFVPAKLSEARRTGGTRERNEAKPGRKRCCANDMLSMRISITYFRNRILLPIPMLVKRNMQIPMDFECFGMARRERPLRRKSPEKKTHPLLIGKRVRPAAVNQPSGLTSVILSVFSQNRACDVSIGTLLSRLP